MRRKQLPWNLHYPGLSPMPTIIQSPYSFAQTVSPCVKPSYHHILERSPFAIPSVPFHLQSLSSGSLAILLFQATILQIKQPNKPPSLPQTQLFPSLYLALFKSSTKRFMTLHQYLNGLLQSTNIEGFLKINNRKDDILIARLRSSYHPSLKQYLHWLDPVQDLTCPNCRQEERDLIHWLRDCPALLSVRKRVFGCHQGSLEWLATWPGDVVAYARKTLVNLDA